jgi:hypothetical protein
MTMSVTSPVHNHVAFPDVENNLDAAATAKLQNEPERNALEDTGSAVPPDGTPATRSESLPPDSAIPASIALRIKPMSAPLESSSAGSAKGTYDNGVLDMPVPLNGPVDMSDTAMGAGMVKQGGAGDCWYIATLNSLTNIPEGRDLLRQNMVWNPNRKGYDVTLYRDGKPEKFFVNQVFEDGAISNEGSANWASVYESALVQYLGQASKVNGGFGNKAMEILMGKPASLQFQNADVARTALKEGKVVTATSNPDYWIFTADTIGLKNVPVRGDQGSWSNRDIEIVRGHAYSVESADSNGNVYVRNPWGSGNTADGGGLIKLTPDQYRQCFSVQSVGSR